MEGFWKRACLETALAAASATVFGLFALSLFAVFVQAYAPSDVTVFVVSRVIRNLGIFLSTLFFVRQERSLFKGAAAGVLALFLTTLVFGLIGGFRFKVFFLLEILISALFGALGAVLRAKLRKD